MATKEGTLKHGLKVGDTLHKHYVLRDATTADLFDAEDEASPSKRLQYRGALIGRQLVKLGELSGPIKLDLIRKLHPADFDALVAAQAELEEAGKAEPAS